MSNTATEVKVIGICDLMEQLFPGYWDNLNFLKYDYETTSKAVREWCEANNAHYYAQPKEKFWVPIGVGEAIELGKPIVVVEDLS